MMRSFFWLDKSRMQNEDEKESFINHAKAWPSQYTDNLKFDETVFACSNEVDTPEYSLQTFISGSQESIVRFDSDGLYLATIFDPKKSDTETTQRAWQKLLQILNLGQFLPWFFAGTRKGIDEGHFGQLQWGKGAVVLDESEWDHILQLADEEVHELITELAMQGALIPVVGYELVDERGAAIAEAELAWEETKIVVLLGYQVEESKSAFEDAGWKVFELENKAEIINSLMGEK